MAGRWMLAVLSSLLTLALILTPGLSVQCFLCSFSPRYNSTRMDGCTDANFTEEQIESQACDLGCEAVTVYDINGEMESFHRNCATNDTIMLNACETYKTRALTRHVCSCDFSYCNAAVSSQWAGGGGGGLLGPLLCAGLALALASTT